MLKGRFSFTRSLHRRFPGLVRALTVAVPIVLVSVLLTSSALAATTINIIDSAGNVGSHTSLVLDSSGFPVVSYRDVTNGDLKLAHCNDPSCAGGDESIATVDSAGSVGEYTSLVLDGSGFPVVSYTDATNVDLKLVHCNDPNCEGGDESIVTVDSVGDVGLYTSMVLDVSGFPVISYFDDTNFDLKLVHCNDANCSGGDESIVAVDTVGNVGEYTSLVLDGFGFPVVSYWDDGNRDLKLAHCNDANCAGGDESIVTVDSAGNVGSHTSLALDGSGFPVISYWDPTNDDLKLAHCNDANCAGGDENIVTVDSGGSVGEYTSLALDSSGNPVVSYYYDDELDLRLAHCNDPNCVGRSIVTVDSGGWVGSYSSLVLDSFGFPLVSYYDASNDDLKLAHCDDANCGGGDESLITVDSAGNVGFQTSLVLDSSGNPVVSYLDVTNLDLKLAHCNDANCAGLDESLTTVDSAGNVGFQTSLVLDSFGNPVVSYYDGTNLDLKLAHCNDANCAGLDESLVTVDSGGSVGGHSSLVLDGSGFPVLSYHDNTNGDLKLAHCNDPNCSGGGDSLVIVDSSGFVGWFTSLVLDGSGNPVISYYDVTNTDLKLAHCNDPNCEGGG